MNELIYSLEESPSATNHYTCVISLIEIEKGGVSCASQRPLTKALLATLATEGEREALSFLLNEEISFLRGRGRPVHYTTFYNKVHIACSHSPQAIKLLAATNKFFFKGKKINIDSFSKVEFYFFIEPTADDKVSLTGRLKTPLGDSDIRKCDFICSGPPHWFIADSFVKFISTEVSWKHLKKAYTTNPWTMNRQEKQRFLEEFEDVKGAEESAMPKLIFAEALSYDLAKRAEPLPVLMLKDRTGAFADLWFDYGNGYAISYHHPSKNVVHPQTKHSIKRDRSLEEKQEKDLLETSFIKKLVGTTHYYCPLDKVAKSLSFLLEVGWQIFDHQGNRVVNQSNVNLALQQEQEKIVVKGKINYQSFEVNVADVIGAFNRRERFVSLSPGTVGLLPDKWEQMSLEALADEGEVVSGSIEVKKNRLGSFADIWDFQQGMVLDNSLKDLKEKMVDFKGIAEALPGACFKGHLRPYQQEGLNWLSFLYEFGFHGLLADDMGLGKTVQVLAFLSRIELNKPTLIVLPTSLLFNWRNEIDRFLTGVSVHLHHGPMRLKDPSFLQKWQIILTSYATLRQDLSLLSLLSFQCIILDEAQLIKNSHTLTAQAIYALQARARFRLSITGTPIENHLGELWAHFRFLIPDLFDKEDDFMAETRAALLDHRHLDRIRKRIRPFFLRRDKEQVAKDLPERIDQTILVEMPAEQRQIYDAFLSGVKGNLLKKVKADGIGKHRMEVLEAILRLRQICCHPLLISSVLPETTNKTSAKMDLLLEDSMTAMEEGKKVLIYSQFTSMLQLFAKELQERNLSFAYLDGSTRNREQIVKKFQEDKSIHFFLVSLKAGGVGLNLTAADYVFLYDPWWNEAVENQAINRAHRIGRQGTVIAKRYICIESIEEKMMKLKGVKRSFIEGLLDEEDAVSSSLTEEDFLFLLS